MRTMLWFSVVAVLLAAVPAHAETRPSQPKGSGIIQKGPDGVAKPAPGATKTKPPVDQAKPFIGGSQEGTGI